MFNTKWFIRFTGPWFKPKAPPVSLIPEDGYSVQQIPIGECSHDLGINDAEETETLKRELAKTKSELEEASRRAKLLEVWFDNFEDLSYWMHAQGLWDAEDVDHDNPMQTYKNGLTRFLNKQNIQIKP